MTVVCSAGVGGYGDGTQKRLPCFADGSRRTLALSDLNSDATVQINEERGTPLQFSL